ncbi:MULTISPECIES: LuxR C-terminal-related transcriptional regulator [unclassified Arthrobacter]|uniref:LuxR C-terminal-related transcriptional regulator n=1 Tax=unclassified Arthrobacter TaxID=235627 RepID=UPI0011B0A8FE|nr:MULTISPECIES: LuxR C-terminal-related transcriptional regulator [unclassified Arthrobacter]
MSTLLQSGPPGDPATPDGRVPGSLSPAGTPYHRTPVPSRSADARGSARMAVRDALDGSGAVILGPPGIGKTTLAREAVDLCEDGFRVHLRGSPLSAQTPYGAMAWLLSDLPPQDLVNPVQVLRALESLLIRLAGGRRIILVIDNAEGIDDLGVLVTSELCRRGTVALLLICGDLLGCHQDYVRLWTDGTLKRIDLAPMDLPETAELLATAAGGPLTTLAQEKLWQQSRGNPLLAALLCRDHKAAKALVLRRGYWTWTGPLVHSGELPDRVETVLRRFTPGERHAVEILALCGGLPLETLLQLLPAHTVDALEEGSLVTIGGGPGQPVRLAWNLQPATIAARIPFGRSRDLWTEVTRVVNPQLLSGDAAAGMAAWSLSVGVSLDPDEALAAARWSNETGDVDAALRYSRAVPSPRPLPLVLEEAAALRSIGNHAQAHRCLAAAQTGSEASHDRHISLLTQRALAAARILDSTDDPPALLQQAERLLPEDEGANPGPGLRLTLARAEILSLDGRLGDLPASLGDDFADPAAPSDLRLMAGIRRGQQDAAAGRFDEALELVALIRSRLAGGISADVRTREQLFHHLFFLLIRCGELGQALAMTELVARPGNGTGLRAAAGTELPAGLVHAYAGRGDTAMDFLNPALAQLESRDPDNMLPLASAAAAYSDFLGPEPGMQPDREAYAESGYRTDPYLETAVRYFRILSTPAGTGRTAEQLHTRAGHARAEGNLPDALLCYGAAALRGSRAAAADLSAAASSANGIPGLLYRNLADGLLEKDAATLIRAGETALGQSNTLLAYEAAGAARSFAADGGGRALSRRARQLEHVTFRELSPANSIEHGLSRLGHFERELALLAAAGETSARLGERFHLSARTVDWHLGRIFARLSVSGRSDLRAALSGKTT